MLWSITWGSFVCIWLSNYSSTMYWKVFSFSIELSLHLCQISGVHIWTYFWSFYSVPKNYLSNLMPIPLWLDQCSFRSLEIATIGLQILLFFSKVIWLTITGPFYFCRNWRITLSISIEKKLLWILIGMT